MRRFKRPIRFRFQVTPIIALCLLVGFLAWGVSERIVKGPLEGGQSLLGFKPLADGQSLPASKPLARDRSFFGFKALARGQSLFGSRPDSSATPASTVSLPPLPAGDPVPCLLTGEVGRNRTLSQVLDNEGVPPEQAQQFLVRLASLTDMRRIRPEDQYRLFSDRTGQVVRLEFQPEPARYFVIERDTIGVGLKAWREDEPVQKAERKVTGTVHGSLYASMVEQGIHPTLVAAFCDVFSYDVDFATETRDGDSYEFLIAETLKDGRPIDGGRLLGGRYTNGGKTFEAVYFENSQGHGAFYHPNGESLRKAFLKSPLNYTRISSYFSTHRLHPIFKTVRPHLGVDYAAPSGTPVVSVADGTVLSAGWANGFGNLIKVKHNNGIVTFYGHLSRIARGVRRGASVDQNEVIGYVGQTGYATGPHLDFRIETAGRFIDPLRFKSSAGEPLRAADRPGFNQTLAQYREKMEEPNLATKAL